jgi:hypothetical protein
LLVFQKWDHEQNTSTSSIITSVNMFVLALSRSSQSLPRINLRISSPSHYRRTYSYVYARNYCTIRRIILLINLYWNGECDNICLLHFKRAFLKSHHVDWYFGNRILKSHHVDWYFGNRRITFSVNRSCSLFFGETLLTIRLILQPLTSLLCFGNHSFNRIPMVDSIVFRSYFDRISGGLWNTPCFHSIISTK